MFFIVQPTIEATWIFPRFFRKRPCILYDCTIANELLTEMLVSVRI